MSTRNTIADTLGCILGGVMVIGGTLIALAVSAIPFIIAAVFLKWIGVF